MLASADHNHKFAPPASSPGACAKGGRRSPLLASAATSLDHREHRSSDTALGRRCVMCRSTSALGRTGRRFAGLGCFIDVVPPKHLAGRFGVRSSFRAIDGIGKRSTAPLANTNHSLRNRAQQCLAKGYSHFPMSFRNHRLDSHDANENGLTNAETSFAPGAKAHD